MYNFYSQQDNEVFFIKDKTDLKNSLITENRKIVQNFYFTFGEN